jgi:hypothetical protein
LISHHRNFCKNFQDHNNATKRIVKFVQNCLNQSQFYQYSAVSYDLIPLAPIEENFAEAETLKIFTNTSMLDISMEFSSNIRTVHDEVYILDGIGLLGSLGGSLGLFIGFSFFGYIANIIDTFANIISSKLIKVENEKSQMRA